MCPAPGCPAVPTLTCVAQVERMASSHRKSKSRLQKYFCQHPTRKTDYSRHFILFGVFFLGGHILNRGNGMHWIGYNGQRWAEKPAGVFPPSCPPVSPSVSYGQRPCDTEASSNLPLVILSKVRESARNGFEDRQAQEGTWYISIFLVVRTQ